MKTGTKKKKKNYQHKSPKGKRCRYHLGQRKQHAVEAPSFHSVYAPPFPSGGSSPPPPKPSPNLILKRQIKHV